VRTVIVGGVSRGKSTLAHELHERHGWPVFCADPASKVVYQKPYTTYLPEGLDFAGDNGGAAWVASHWLAAPGPWIVEGHALARALRRWVTSDLAVSPHWKGMFMPADRIIVLDRPAHRPTTVAQEALSKGVMKVWMSIAHHFTEITEVRT